jgi:hypothetical protein
LHSLTWTSTYRVQIRMVDQLRIGPVFLAGDAAHVHPIAGGHAPATGHPTQSSPRGGLFDLFRGPHFTLLGIGTRAAAAVDALGTTNLIRSHLITSPTVYPNDTLVLVRPDGYIGIVTNAADTHAVTAYLASL